MHRSVFRLFVLLLGCLAGCSGSPSESRRSQQQPLRPDIFDTSVVGTEGDPGDMDGQLSISRNGDAAFTMPIQIPAGRGGIQPELALSYDSAAGDGIAGLGWRLDGLSQIRRCARNPQLDGVRGGIRWREDTYCLDGGRLVASKSGFRDGGDYRVVRDGYDKIVRRGPAAAPEGFEVWRRDGTIHTYGSPPKSKALGTLEGEYPGSTATLAWLRTRIEDRRGNAIVYEYDGEDSHLARIRYTVNDAWPGGERQVRLVYGPRPDLKRTFLAEAEFRSTQRLTAVETYAPSAPGRGDLRLVRSYRLNYDGCKTSTGKSLLCSVRECDAAGVCTQPLSFGWGDTELDLTERPTQWLTGRRSRLLAGPLWPGDNGGLRAIESLPDGSGAVFLRRLIDGQVVRLWGTDGLLASLAGAADDERLTPFDHDNNGDFGFLRSHRDGGSYRVSIGNVTGVPATYLDPSGSPLGSEYLTSSVSERPGPELCSTLARWLLADLDGDGASDIVYACDTGRGYFAWFAKLHDPATMYGVWGPVRRLYDLGSIGAETPIVVDDFDGDGRAEFVYPTGYGGFNRVFLREEGGSDVPVPVRGLDATAAGFFGDVNGDGLKDRVDVAESSRVLMNYGGGFHAPSPMESAVAPGSPELSGRLRVGDFNRDGRDDVIAGTSLYVSNGERFEYIADIHDGDSSDFLLVDSDEDGLLETLRRAPGGRADEWILTRLFDAIPDRLVRVKQNGGVRYELSWERVSRGGYCSYPNACGATRDVVSSVKGPTGLHEDHEYLEPAGGVDGAGWAGFRYHAVTQRESGVLTETFYGSYVDDPRLVPPESPSMRDAYERVPLRIRRSGRDADGRLRVRETRMGYDVQAVSDVHHHVLLSSLEETEWLASDWDKPCGETCRERAPARDALVLSHATTTLKYDDRSSLTLQRTTADGVGTNTVEITPTHYASDYLLGLPGFVVMTDSPVVGPTKRRTTKNLFYHDGMLERTSIEPGTDQEVTTKVGYDPLGLVTALVTIADPDHESVTKFTYDEDRVHLRTSRNPLGHEITQYVQPGLDAVVATVSESGVESYVSYDGFGRPVRATSGDVWSETQYRLSDSRIPLRNVEQTDAAGNRVVTFYDALNRPRYVLRSRGTDGCGAISEATYDELGRITRTAAPRVLPCSGAIPLAENTTSYVYGALGELLSTSSTNGESRHFEYHGLTTIVTDEAGHTTTIEYDSAGRKSRVSEAPASPGAAGSVMSYQYGAFGVLSAMWDERRPSSGWSYEYDAYGRRLLESDPDAGATRTEFDALGRIVKQFDASGVLVSSVDYDLLGRAVLLWTADDGNTIFEWDVTRAGKLHSATAERDGVQLVYDYDEQDRAEAVHLDIDGERFSAGFEYDVGLLRRLTYPGGLVVRYGYAVDGSLASVEDESAGRILYRRLERDAEDRTTLAQFGNLLQTERKFDPTTGALTEIGVGWSMTPTLPGIERRTTRHVMDLAIGYTRGLPDRLEDLADIGSGVRTFEHDRLGRLTKDYVDGVLSHDRHYDELGNLLGDGEHTYTLDPAHVHRLDTADGTAVRYDARGRLVSGPRILEATWSNAGLPRSIETEPGARHEYRYDAFGNRTHHVDPSGVETISVGGIYERTRTPGGETIQRFNVLAEGRVVAQVSEAAGTRTTTYLHEGNTGSVTAVSDQSGEIIARYRYSPFGERTASLDTSSGTTSIGFTGHTHDDTGLIDMGGRVYSPLLKRMLTPDPVLAHGHRQDANPYAYVSNSPLRYTDPSGYWRDCGPYGSGYDCAPSSPILVEDDGTYGGQGAGDLVEEPHRDPGYPVREPARRVPYGEVGTGAIAASGGPGGAPGDGQATGASGSDLTVYDRIYFGLYGFLDLPLPARSAQTGEWEDHRPVTGLLWLIGVDDEEARLSEEYEFGQTMGMVAGVTRLLGGGARALGSGARALRAARAERQLAAIPRYVGPASRGRGILRSAGGGVWTSRGGLRYGADPNFGNRVRHVLRHAADIPGRPGRHGVFDGGGRSTLGVVDEAWAIAQRGGSGVSIIQQGNRTVYIVDMGRRVGFVGGQAGAAAGNPAASHVQLVLRGIDVITAFPVIP